MEFSFIWDPVNTNMGTTWSPTWEELMKPGGKHKLTSYELSFKQTEHTGLRNKKLTSVHIKGVCVVMGCYYYLVAFCFRYSMFHITFLIFMQVKKAKPPFTASTTYNILFIAYVSLLNTRGWWRITVMFKIIHILHSCHSAAGSRSEQEILLTAPACSGLLQMEQLESEPTYHTKQMHL